MKRQLALTLTALLALTGCATTPPPTTSPAAPATKPEPVNDCLQVHTDSESSIQRHLDAVWDDQHILDAAAVLSPNATTAEPAWFVAAEVNSQGDNVTAVWFTTNNPTLPGNNAFMSIDAMAAAISDYLRPEGASASMEGAQQARDCLR